MDSKLIIFLVCMLYAKINKTFCQEFMDSKILGGTIAKIANERHFVSIRLKKKEEKEGYGSGHHCGGTLIRPN